MLERSLENVLTIWKDESNLKNIKEIYGKDLTDLEFKTFVQLGVATGLNPFLREIWAVKYDKTVAAQIFIGRDGYRKSISNNANYEIHQVDAVYSNDDFCFDLIKGEVKHTYNFKDRGHLIGAYCLVYMKNKSKPYYVFAELKEYDLNQSVWKTKKATMIKKVAECQAIRMADSCSFNGTYGEDELPEHMQKESKASELNKKLELNTFEGEVVNAETGEVNSVKQPEPEIQKEETKTESAAPIYTFAEVKAKLENAKSIDKLNDAAQVISGLQLQPTERIELQDLYRSKLRELKS